jgi:predicted O-methyltransferase YrrM
VSRRLKQTYAGGVRRLGTTLVRRGWISPTPPPRDRRWAHWAHSLVRVHDSLAIAELDVPWWTYRAVEAVDAWLAARPHPVRVFEYGSGASTLWLAKRVDQVHSVEHDGAFAGAMAPAFAAAGNIDFHVVEPEAMTDPVVPSAKGGHRGLDFARYVAAIDGLDGEFDLIVIDGRAREACLRRAVARLALDGLIVFDNTARRRYRAAIAAAPVTERRLAGLTPTLPYPEQTSLLTLT